MRQLRWEIDEAETRLHEETQRDETESDKIQGHSFAMPGNGQA